MRKRLGSKLGQLRHLVSVHDGAKHRSEALGILYLVLHVVVALEDGEVPFWPGLHDGIPVLEVVFLAAEFPERMALEFFWELWEGSVFERVSHHAAEIAAGKGLACLYEVGLDCVIVAPEDVPECASL